jgi:FAD binding domain
MPDATTLDLAPLRDRCKGAVLAPEDDGYDAARVAFNLTVDQRPAAVALPADADDVAEIVRFAREERRQVAPQRTGHNAAPLGSLDDALLLRTDAMRGAEVDAERRTARAMAGAQWTEVVPQASALGLAPLHGSAPNVGVVGYTLGGGVGWYARKHGLACNRVSAVELVTGEGQLVRADAQSEPGLFWALRGGGGNFGVVTAIEFDLLPIERVFAGVLFFPFERASEVLHAWHEWLPGVPEEVTSVGRLLQFPPFEEIPEPMRGKSFAIVEAVCLLDEDAAAELLAPLRQLGPAMDTFASLPPEGISGLHMDPPEPVPAASAHELLGDLPAQAIDELVAAVGPDSGSSLISVELRHGGGALSRAEPGAGALSSLAGEFVSFGVGATPAPPMAEAVGADLDRLTAALAPYACGRFLNFTEGAYDVRKMFGDETFDKLRAIKAEHDPEGIIKANHSVIAT